MVQGRGVAVPEGFEGCWALEHCESDSFDDQAMMIITLSSE